MFKATVAGLLAHKLRLALTAFSIVLGVAFVCATLILSNGLQKSFDDIFNNQGTQVTVVVRGHLEQGGQNGGFSDAHRPVPDTLVGQVKSVSGVSTAEGIVFRAGASPLDPSGHLYNPNGGAPEFGTNWINSADLSPYHIRSGAPPANADDVVIDAATAKAHNITVGQHVTYVVNGGAKRTFTVSGIAGYGTSDSLAGATISLFRLDTVQGMFDLQGKLDQIAVKGDSGVGDTELRDRIAKTLPPEAEAVTGAQAVGEQKAGVDSFFTILRNILLVFGLVALFVGSYIIVNTFNILIAQRTRELALLRALGASRGQVFRLVLVEALIVGLLGSIIGVIAGLLLAYALYGAISSIGSGLPKADLVLSGGIIATGIILGTVVTIAASALPARRASRVAPVAAIREAEDTAAEVSGRRIVTGAVVAVVGAALIGFGLFGGSSNLFYFLGAGAFLLFIGVSILAPLTVVPIAGTLGRPIEASRGAPGKLARVNAVRAPRRTASTAAALMIGVSLVVGVAVLTASAEASTRAAVSDAVLADYLVFSSAQGSGGAINTSTTADLAGDKHFGTVTDIKIGTILVGGSSTSATALDPSNYQSVFKLDPASGDVNSLSQPDTIFVDQKQAADNNWKVGDTINVNFPQANVTKPMRIGCIFNINALANGYIISSRTYDAYFPEKQSFAILITKASGVSFQDGWNALQQDLKAYPTLKAYDKASFLQQQSDQLNQLTSIINVFLVMAIIIASLGIVNTMALSIMERTRELGLLRSIGLNRRQTRTMVRWESVLIAFLGLVLGAALGIALGVAVVRALAATGISHISVPWASLIIYAVGALIVGLLAAILPARRAARLNVLEAIASE